MKNCELESKEDIMYAKYQKALNRYQRIDQDKARPDFYRMNAGINQIVQEYHMRKDEKEMLLKFTEQEIRIDPKMIGKYESIDKDELELLRAKAWAFDGGSPNYVWQSKDQLLACYRDRKVR